MTMEHPQHETEWGEYEIIDEYAMRELWYSPNHGQVVISPDGVQRPLPHDVEKVAIHPGVETYTEVNADKAAIKHAADGEMRVVVTDEWPYGDSTITGVRVVPTE